jgi:hypothetical protein
LTLTIHNDINETLGENIPERDAEEIEDIVRHDIFHSTLDWQTKAMLQRGIRQAYEVYLYLEAEASPPYPEYTRET